MRIVILSRVPRWYSFRHDNLVKAIAADHEIAGIVVEKTATIASLREWIRKLGPDVFMKLARKGTRAIAGAGSRSHSSPVFYVEEHNCSDTVRLLRSLRPDVIVLRGCGIIRKPILEIPNIGTINPHYAMLPTYRGMDVTEWSALHGDLIAVSVHWVTEGVDTGAVISSAPVHVVLGDTVGLLRDKSAALAVDLIAYSLGKIASGQATPTRVTAVEGHQYFSMHPRLRQLANLRLAKVA